MSAHYDNVKNAVNRNKQNMNMEVSNYSSFYAEMQDIKNNLTIVRKKVDKLSSNIDSIDKNHSHPSYINKNLFAMSNNLYENIQILQKKYDDLLISSPTILVGDDPNAVPHPS